MKLADLSAPPGSKVDIIVRARNGHDLTEACLASILGNTPGELYRLILVDDGSDVPYEAVDAADVLVRCEENHGAVTATNLGLGISFAFSDSDYVLILDNDTRIPEGDQEWLARMLAELEQGGPQCAAVGATTNCANAPQHALTAPTTYTHDWEDEQRAGRKENPAITAFVSFAVLLRKAALRKVGLWDERYNPGNYEDTDYSVHLRTLGYSIRVARSVYIHHNGHATFGEQLQTLLDENSAKFYEKWGVGRLFDLGFIEAEHLKAVL